MPITMTRNLFPCLALCLTTAISAQSWCPPGATWTYTYGNGWTIDGLARFTYMQDTLIDGHTAQRIAFHIEGTSAGSPVSLEFPPVHTTVDGDLVSILTATGFDTLYWFGALPGDHWGITMPDGMASYGEVLVTDTGTRVIDGVPLRYLVTDTDTITQRLGASFAFMLPWVQYILDEPGGPLRCYGDGQIDHHAAWWSLPCDFLLGVNDAGADPGGLPTVVSADGQLLVSTPFPGMLSITDATGRVVLRTTVAAGEVSMDASTWKVGIYHAFLQGAGATHHIRFAHFGQ